MMVEERNMPQQRRVFLITYSQADLEEFPDCASFSKAVVRSFGSQHVKEWACCREPHQDGGEHYHMAISFNSSRRWGAVKKDFLRNYNAALHFSAKTFGYVAAYRYVCKDKEKEEVLHSPGHTNMSTIASPKTKKAMRRWSEVSSSQKREATNTHSGRNDNKKAKRLSNVAVSNLLVEDGIKKESELMRLALQRAQNGEPDLQAFILSKPPKALADLISTTWKIQNSASVAAREEKSRMDLLREYAAGSCVANCNGEWLLCAKQVLANNNINMYYYACTIRKALFRGRSKNNNVLIVGPTNCGKSFLLNPLELIYKTFVNPANARYAWVDMEGCEVAYLNDFRWSREIIEWSDFLLLLEGQTVHLPRPKNQFSSALLVPRDNTIPFFATSKGPIEFIGKFNVRDDRESDMMASRWHKFSFHHQIDNPKVLEPCPRCFAVLAMEGHLPGEE